LVTSALVVDGVDYVPLFRDDAAWAALAEAIAPYYHEDVECRMVRFDGEATYKGLGSLRAAWLDWLIPWESYRVESHDVVDLGDQVLLPAYNLGCLHGSAEEVRMDGAAVFTFREGKVARAEFYVDRAEALKAVGLEQ
jgi:ketosteroid isomerase-like protein